MSAGHHHPDNARAALDDLTAAELTERLGEPTDAREHPANTAARGANVLDRLIADLDELPGDQLLAVGELRLKLAAALLPGRPRTIDITIERQAQDRADATYRVVVDELVRRNGVEPFVASVVARSAARLVLTTRRLMGPAGVGRPVRDYPG